MAASSSNNIAGPKATQVFANRAGQSYARRASPLPQKRWPCHLSGCFTQPLILALVLLIVPMVILPTPAYLDRRLGTLTMFPYSRIFIGQIELYRWPRQYSLLSLLMLLGTGIS